VWEFDIEQGHEAATAAESTAYVAITPDDLPNIEDPRVIPTPESLESSFGVDEDIPQGQAQEAPIEIVITPPNTSPNSSILSIP
jgi:hypothetical protein